MVPSTISAPREQIADIVPRDQPAEIRFTSFRYRTTKRVEGRVSYVSGDRLVDCSALPPRSRPSQASILLAISGEMPACPFSTRDRAVRVTPSWPVASVTVTVTPSAGRMSSRRVSPGWGG